jgi:hypothetical protein
LKALNEFLPKIVKPFNMNYYKIIDRFTIRNKFLFITGFLIFISASWYSFAKNDDSVFIILLTLFGGGVMCLGFRKSKENIQI